MQTLDYLRTAGGIIWTAACIPLGILLSWSAVWIINKVPASWLCDYNETPSEELMSGQRVSFRREGVWLAGLLTFSLVLCRLQFNQGFDMYFICFALIILFAVMIAVCDIKYMIIPDQFTIAVGILGTAVSIYDIVRGFKILHPAWWSPLLGIVIGGGAMLIIDLIGMVVYKKDGMGFGDVKLFAAIGILTGFPGTIYTFIISLLTATVCFIIIIAVSKAKSRSEKTVSANEENNSDENDENNHIPNNGDLPEETEELSVKSYLAFGPYIAIALICYMVLFDGIYYLANLYLDLF